MKKILFVAIVVVILAVICIVVSQKKNETNEESAENVLTGEETVEEPKLEGPQEKIDIEETIKAETKEYFEMICEGEVADVKVTSIKIYDGTEPMADYVDLDEFDYMFEMDLEVKLSNQKDIEMVTEHLGKYDEESGYVVEHTAYGVMRYNYADKGYDITSITSNSF